MRPEALFKAANSMALVCARLFGPEARAPVRLAALAYVGFVAFVFVQALKGLPLIPL